MEWRYFLFLVVISAIGVTSGLDASEGEAKEFLRLVSSRLYHLYNEISDETYDIDNKLFFAALEEHGMAKKISSAMLELSTEAKRYNTEQFKDPDVIKGIKKLRSADLFVLGDEFFGTLGSSLAGLTNMTTNKFICNYKHREVCNMAYVPDVRRIFTNSMDPYELTHYWYESRQKQLESGIYNFVNVVEFLRIAAEKNGVSVKEFWFRDYGDADFLTEMEKVMQQLKPFYQEFHSFIRLDLALRYGASVVSVEGPIPDHLIEQILAQAWKKDSILSQSYPRQRLPNLKEGLESHGFDIGKILDHAEDFYQSIGLDPIPSSIKETRFKELSQKIAGKDCKAEIFDKTPRVYMKYCKASTFKKFLQTHGYLGRLHYALEKKDLPFYFFPSFELEYPLGEAAILSASTPDHMNRAEILNHFNYTSELAMNRLFRMGVHTIFSIPLHFVNVKVMVDVLEGTVPLERVNRHYWKLMDEYAGIEPPVDRTVKLIDFSYKFFEDLAHNHQTRKFISEILGYQMYESFCLMSGNFVKGDPNKPLHGCDFYGNKDVGLAMKKMMQMGSKYSWREALNITVQGATGMSASSLLEYYRPLHEWLRERNSVMGTKVGWTPSTRVVL